VSGIREQVQCVASAACDGCKRTLVQTVTRDRAGDAGSHMDEARKGLLSQMKSRGWEWGADKRIVCGRCRDPEDSADDIARVGL
jgi:hypothetical protein